MNLDTFWELIERTSTEAGGDIEQQVAALVRELSALPIEEIFRFEEYLVQHSQKAYDAKLHAAGSVIDDLSDDDFQDFRLWLISRGKAAYSRCLDDPEALVEIAHPGDGITAEEMGAIASRAYREKTGTNDFSARFSPLPYPELKNSSLAWKTPEGYADPVRLRVLFPKLWARFGDRF